MNKADRARFSTIIDQANTLVDGKGNGITNIDVIEAMLGDIALVVSSRDPYQLSELIELDNQCEREPKC